MNSNLLLGSTLKSERQVARDAQRALNSARINLDQAARFGSDALIVMSKAAVESLTQDVKYWKARGLI